MARLGLRGVGGGRSVTHGAAQSRDAPIALQSEARGRTGPAAPAGTAACLNEPARRPRLDTGRVPVDGRWAEPPPAFTTPGRGGHSPPRADIRTLLSGRPARPQAPSRII